jgi:hypothetical protein
MSNRMLKKSASFVLSSSKSSTYLRMYASGFDSPAALLNSLFEHPEISFRQRHTGDSIGILCTNLVFPLEWPRKNTRFPARKHSAFRGRETKHARRAGTVRQGELVSFAGPANPPGEPKKPNGQERRALCHGGRRLFAFGA